MAKQIPTADYTDSGASAKFTPTVAVHKDSPAVLDAIEDLIDKVQKISVRLSYLEGYSEGSSDGFKRRLDSLDEDVRLLMNHVRPYAKRGK